MRYIALLRGINVGGHLVKMEHLRALFSELGLTNVRSYIQSGNVFFESDSTDHKALTTQIEEHLAGALGYAVPICLRTVAELESLIALDPFKNVPEDPDIRLCIAFTAAPVAKDLAFPIISAKNDIEIIGGTKQELFMVWHIINGRPPAFSSYLAKLLGGKTTTTRFFHTTMKILAAAQKDS